MILYVKSKRVFHSNGVKIQFAKNAHEIRNILGYLQLIVFINLICITVFDIFHVS